MFFFNLFRKVAPAYEISQVRCRKVFYLGKELAETLHDQIDLLCSPNYPTASFETPFFNKQKIAGTQIILIATMGLSLIQLIHQLNTTAEQTKQVKICLKRYHELCMERQDPKLYQKLIEFLQSYFDYIESSDILKSSNNLTDTYYVGAWIILSYLGAETIIYTETANSIGTIIKDCIQNPWRATQ